ncbi:MAG: hypothetical protein BWY83_02713 [bacterium ADurb.Bin478]|nr:MAG: hypothetical protein BWY83_02713 [bacterium ADurb.Bin478]
MTEKIVDHAFAHQLGLAIDRLRSKGAGLISRRCDHMAVDAHGAGVNEPPYAAFFGCAQQIRQRFDVDLFVHLGCQSLLQVGAGQMKHHIDALENLLLQSAVAEIALHHPAGLLPSQFLQRIAVQIKSDHLMAAGEQPGSQMPSDKPVGAGYQRFHQRPPSGAILASEIEAYWPPQKKSRSNCDRAHNTGDSAENSL